MSDQKSRPVRDILEEQIDRVLKDIGHVYSPDMSYGDFEKKKPGVVAELALLRTCLLESDVLSQEEKDLFIKKLRKFMRRHPFHASRDFFEKLAKKIMD